MLGVWQARRCSAFLGVARRHRCLQVSTFTDLSVARRIRSVGSVGRRWQPQRAAAAGAGGRAMGWTTPPHHTIKLFSKSRKDSIKDRIGLYAVLGDSLRLRSANCKIKKHYILKGEI